MCGIFIAFWEHRNDATVYRNNKFAQTRPLLRAVIFTMARSSVANGAENGLLPDQCLRLYSTLSLVHNGQSNWSLGIRIAVDVMSLYQTLCGLCITQQICTVLYAVKANVVGWWCHG